MTCNNCGSYVKDGSKFCMTCGNAVTPKPAAQPVQPTPMQASPVQPTPMQSTPVQPASSMQYQQPVQNRPAAAPVSDGHGSKGPAIASMVCGIVGLVLAVLCSCTGGGAIVSAILAIVAISLAIWCKTSNLAGKKMAVAGLTCGIIALVITIIIGGLAAIGRSAGKQYINSNFDFDQLEDIFGDL